MNLPDKDLTAHDAADAHRPRWIVGAVVMVAGLVLGLGVLGWLL